MGLRCSLLGHSFESAGVEREREETGGEVITTEREIDRCSRCGAERVVSESTDVTTIIDGKAVELDDETALDSSDGGIAGALDRSDAVDDPDTEATDETTTEATSDRPLEGPETAEDPTSKPDAAEEDAEILTEEDDPERDPGEWPEAADPESDETAAESGADPETPAESTLSESLSGLTVPEGKIVCPECAFRIDAHSGYRAGDPCPDCAAWLEAERNQ